MFAVKGHEWPHNNQNSVAASGLSHANYQSGDNKLSTSSAGPSNSAPGLAPAQALQVTMYTKDDLKRILRTV